MTFHGSISVEAPFPEPLVLTDTICTAADDSSNHGIQGLSFAKGDILTILGRSTKTECTIVRGPDGSIGEAPLICLRTRPPVSVFPLPYYHQGGMSQEESEALLNKDGQFIVIPSENDSHCIVLRSEGVVKQYIIAVGANRQLTVDGSKCFSSLPVLIEFYQIITNHSKNNVAIPDLREPVPVSRGTMLYYIDQEELAKYWGLPSECIKRSESIGKGEFGEVFAGTYRGNYQIAVKTLSNSSEDTVTNGRLNLLKEAAVMTHLRHKNLVQLVGVVFDGSSSLQMIAMELMCRGSLSKYLVSRGRSVVSQKELLQYARDVCDGMVYMSCQGFVHRDLAIRNVLLNSNGLAKISDFGLSRPAYIHIDNEEGKFPVKWTAPEALKNRIFSEKSDVWSFGILLWEIYSFGRTPYPSIYADEVLEMLEDGYLMEPPEGCPDGISDIMTACWSFEQDIRPGFLAVREMLSNSFGESRTPCSSPLPIRSALSKAKEQAEKLLNTPIVSEIYHSAPPTHESELHFSNILLVGPKGSGKTSLMRRFQGETFREIEPSTANVQFSGKFCEVADHRSWRESDHGLDYENELVRCIVQHLLKHVQQSLPVPSEIFPPFPPVNRRRSASFTCRDPSLPPRSAHMSMLVEDMSISPVPVVSFSGSQPEGLNRTPPDSPSPKRRSIKRRLSLTKFFRRNTKEKSGSKPMSNHAASTPHLNTQLERTNGHFPLLSAHTVPSDTPPTHPAFASAIPEMLKRKLKEKLTDCVAGVLPPELYVRFIDTPGDQSEMFPSSCLLNDSSIVLAVLDSSKNSEELINDMVAKVNAIFCRKRHSLSASSHVTTPTIVLIGTHTDRTTMLMAKQYLDRGHKALKESGCGQYVTSSSFLVSNSSVLEQSATDSAKSYILELLKNRHSTKVPLKWLKCLRKVQQLSSDDGQYIMPLGEVREVIKDCCEKDQCDLVIEFLHRNHLILHLENTAPFNDLVFTNPKWFIDKLSSLFSLGHPTVSVPSHLSHDYHMLQSQGSLTQALLDEIWQCPKAFQQKLLMLLHQLEILGLRSVGSRPISPWESEHSLSSISLHSTPPPMSPVITKVVIPSLIMDELPAHIANPPFGLEALYFKFSVPYVPLGLFYKLSVRSMQSYPGQCTLYRNGGCFAVDDATTLVVQEIYDSLRVTLQPSHYPVIGHQPCHLTSSDVAMTTLMFLRASISDLLTTWLHDSVTYELCTRCSCDDGSVPHYLPLGEIDRFLAENVPLTCEEGGSISSVPLLVRPWFGEEVTVTDRTDDTDDEMVHTGDIKLIVENLQQNDEEQSTDVVELANEKNLSFLDLISSLENIGCNDLADSLIDARMKTSGIAL